VCYKFIAGDDQIGLWSTLPIDGVRNKTSFVVFPSMNPVKKLYCTRANVVRRTFMKMCRAKSLLRGTVVGSMADRSTRVKRRRELFLFVFFFVCLRVTDIVTVCRCSDERSVVPACREDRGRSCLVITGSVSDYNALVINR